MVAKALAWTVWFTDRLINRLAANPVAVLFQTLKTILPALPFNRTWVYSRG